MELGCIDALLRDRRFEGGARARSFFAQHPLFLEKIGGAGRLLRPGMPGRGHDHQPVAADQSLLEQGIMHRAFHQADLDLAGGHRLGHFRGVAGQHLDAHLRMAGMERHQPGRQPIAGDGLAGHHRKTAALHAGQVGQGAFGGIGLGQNGAGFDEKLASLLGQRDAAADAMKQRDAGLLLQPRDGGGNGRLGAVNGGGGTGDMLALGDCHERAKLLQGHRIDIILFGRAILSENRCTLFRIARIMRTA